MRDRLPASEVGEKCGEDFSTPSPKLLVYVKNSDGVTYKAELPLTRV